MEKFFQEITALIASASSLKILEDIKQVALGKKSPLSEAMMGLRHLSPEERRTQGEHLNALKEGIQAAWMKRKESLEEEEILASLQKNKMDVTCPSPRKNLGRFHPLMDTIQRVVSIFSSMGFSARLGPDVEDVYHNFTALNVGPHHPARASQDTFYMNTEHVLRTQTSPMQIRTMMKEKGALRVVVPGRVYRADALDMTHTPMFHQLEGLVVGEIVHMGHLKSCLEEFLRQFFQSPVHVRFRPSFFPFTEPSAEVDVSCSWTKGRLEVGTGNEWLEILGCGMVHPNVLSACNLDPHSTQGFAFGMGIERLTMLKYGITDIRHFYTNNQLWLRHFGPSIAESFFASS